MIVFLENKIEWPESCIEAASQYLDVVVMKDLLKLPQNKTAQVIASKNRKWDAQNLTADIGILCWPGYGRPSVHIAGWVNNTEIKTITEKDYQPIESLKRAIDKRTQAIVDLTDKDLCDAENVALLRSTPKEKFDTNNVWAQNSPPSFERHLLGVSCELAVAKLFDIDIDRDINDGDKNKGDLILPDGKTIQVKGRLKIGWDYAVRTDKEDFKSDFGVLCWPIPMRDQIIVRGWISKDEFAEKSIIKNYSYGDRKVVESKHFHPIKDLINIYKKNL
jgi:hypothetical protein